MTRDISSRKRTRVKIFLGECGVTRLMEYFSLLFLINILFSYYKDIISASRYLVSFEILSLF